MKNKESIFLTKEQIPKDFYVKKNKKYVEVLDGELRQFQQMKGLDADNERFCCSFLRNCFYV